jgi:hypothetical protein
MNMEIWKKFIEESSMTSEIMEKYLAIRFLLKELGHTQKSIERIRTGPPRLFELRAEISHLMNEVKKKIRKYGFEVSDEDFLLYFQSKMDKIDSLTPLNDGDN